MTEKEILRQCKPCGGRGRIEHQFTCTFQEEGTNPSKVYCSHQCRQCAGKGNIPQRSHDPWGEDAARIDEAVRKAISFFGMEQPAGAITHSGVDLKEPICGLTVSASPQGGSDAGPMLSFKLEWGARFTKDEVTMLVAVVSKHAPLLDMWNGEGSDNLGMRIDRRVHPTLKVACQRYNAGCQAIVRYFRKPDGARGEHDYFKYNEKGRARYSSGKYVEVKVGDRTLLGGSVFCGCGWFGRGARKLRVPEGFR
jgi:hypothetical protein